MHNSHDKFLRQLFSPYFNKISIYYEIVQYQRNQVGCGVFAIAFETSLFFRQNPSKIAYNYESLPPHLYSMLECNQLSHFTINCNDKYRYLPPTSIQFRVKLFYEVSISLKFSHKKYYKIITNIDVGIKMFHNKYSLQQNRRHQKM